METRLVPPAATATSDHPTVIDVDVRARALISSATTSPIDGSAHKRTMLPRKERRSRPMALVRDTEPRSRPEHALADTAARYGTAFNASVVPTAVVLIGTAGRGAIIDGNASLDDLTSELGLPTPARHLTPFLDAESCAALDVFARGKDGSPDVPTSIATSIATAGPSTGRATRCESRVVASDGRTHRLVISATLIDAPHDARRQAVVQIEAVSVEEPDDSAPGGPHRR